MSAVLRLLVIGLLLALTLPGRASAAAAGESGTAKSLQAVLNRDTPGCSVRTQTAAGRSMLLLPASADYKCLTLEGPSGAVLYGSVPGAALKLDAAGRGEDLNLTQLFGSMEAGTPYTLTLRAAEAGRAQSSITLMKSAALSSVHIGLDASLQEIHVNKSFSSAGYLVKLDSEGKILAECVVEGFGGRGNASWSHSGEKRPYNLELEEAAQLVDGAGTARHWCLLSNNVMTNDHDRTGLYNQVALQMFQDLGGASALSAEPVDLYLNREYRGTYLLAEKAEIQENRVDIRKSAYLTEDRQGVTRVMRGDLQQKREQWHLEEIEGGGTNVRLVREKRPDRDELLSSGILAYQYATGSELKAGGAGGYLLELDFRFYESRCWFITRRGAQVVIREPEYATYGQVKEIACYVQQMEDALYADSGMNSAGRHYSDYLDLGSLAVSYALDAFTANTDAFLASAFFYTDRDEHGGLTPLYSGPAWDYDYARPEGSVLLNPRLGKTDNYPEVWVLQFLTKGDFMQELQDVCRNRLRPLWLELNEGRLQAERDRLSTSQKLNGLLWNNNFEAGAARYAEVLQKRYDAWYEQLWQADKLTGLRIVPADGGLEALITGQAEQVRWYRVEEEDGYTLREVGGASGTRFQPSEDGLYVAAATGRNVAWNPELKEQMEYRIKGVPLPVALETVTLYSAPCAYRAGS